MYIVELEYGVWLAPWDGDPGRTLQKENARKFHTKADANYYLTQARIYRPFEFAKVVLA